VSTIKRQGIEMDFKEAIACHVQWKSKLSAYLAKPDHSLDASQLSRDDQCQLGRWLAGDGRKLAGNPEYARLVDEHRRFLAAAAEIVRRADSGRPVVEELVLGAHSDYAKASNDVVTSLMKMRLAG
jgi:hypothetical protein